MFSTLPHSTFTVQILYKLYSVQLNCTYSNYTEAADKYSAAQQHSTLLYKYCTNCTVCNWTVLTVITDKLPLHGQLHYSTAHLLYKYCTNCTVCNWPVLAVMIQNLPLHVQLYFSTAHLLYKYCTNCTVCNWTVLTVITLKLPQMFSCTTTHKLFSDCLLKCGILAFLKLSVYQYVNIQSCR